MPTYHLPTYLFLIFVCMISVCEHVWRQVCMFMYALAETNQKGNQYCCYITFHLTSLKCRISLIFFFLRSQLVRMLQCPSSPCSHLCAGVTGVHVGAEIQTQAFMLVQQPSITTKLPPQPHYPMKIVPSLSSLWWHPSHTCHYMHMASAALGDIVFICPLSFLLCHCQLRGRRVPSASFS